MLQVSLHVFKVVVLGSFLAVEAGESLSGFVTKGNLMAIGVEQDAAWYSLVPSVIEYHNVEINIWADEIGYRAVCCSKVNGS